MYNVLDICRYVIKYGNEKKYGVSNLKLQKLLYFIQAYFIIKNNDNAPCFKEKIEAWNFGPVVPVAYYEYKRYGSTDITFTDSFVDFNKKNPWDSAFSKFDMTCINAQDRQRIEAVVDRFAKFSATDLVDITHAQLPWQKAYVPCMNNEITNDDIREYFCGTK